MKIEVRLFAIARELCGHDALELELPAGSTVAQLRSELGRREPTLASHLPHFIFSRNEEYASEEIPLADGDRVACIPPVSGG